MLLEERMKAKANKDWATSDKIRNELTALGFEIKDGKDGCEWKLNKKLHYPIKKAASLRFKRIEGGSFI